MGCWASSAQHEQKHVIFYTNSETSTEWSIIAGSKQMSVQVSLSPHSLLELQNSFNQTQQRSSKNKRMKAIMYPQSRNNAVLVEGKRTIFTADDNPSLPTRMASSGLLNKTIKELNDKIMLYALIHRTAPCHNKSCIP
jgi:hypothetical protein